ncbi:MAG: hypothetical protein GC159_21860 [Phycisphaera sp.]|nr:hypothetical protein [Phycisphaera sp.]
MAVTNVHGRKGGRGARPYWLIAKVIGVAAYFGGLTAALAITLAVEPRTADQWTQMADTLRAIFLFAAVPGLLLAVVCGIVLSRMHGGVLWRMRWVKLKVAIAVVSVPALHLWVSGVVGRIRANADKINIGDGEIERLHSVQLGLAVAIVVTLTLIYLGRHKPRLGQPVTTLAQQRDADASV